MLGVAEASVGLGVLAAGTSVAGLVATGLVVWRRTAGLRPHARHPRGRPTGRPGATGPSSPTTWLAAAGGAGVALAGVAKTAGTGFLGAAVALAGLLIVATGVRDRVVEVAADDDALVVRRAGRSTKRMAWPDVRALRAPRTPLGGWRVLAATGSITLMPSDLLGREGILEEVVRRIGPVRGRRGWAGPTR